MVNIIIYNNKMIILITVLIIILLTYILINYIKVNESFILLYEDINDYLSKNVDGNIIRDSYCFDNDKLLGDIKGDKTISCASYYEKVGDIYYKHTEKPTGKEKNIDNIFYDIKTEKNYSFAEICPITTGQLNSTLCLRKHNNDISDTIYRLDNIISDTELKLQDDLSDVKDELTTYRNDKYRIFNSTDVQNYYS
jgi:hypothetical protein